MREFTYRFFEQLARIYADELTSYYPVSSNILHIIFALNSKYLFIKTLIPYLLASCESSAGLVWLNEREEFNILPENPEAIQEGENLSLRILQSFMDEKSAAISCLGWLISENSEASASYLESSLHFLAGLSIFDLHPPVACTAIVSFIQGIRGMLNLLDEDYSWEKGKLCPLPQPIKNVN